MPSQFRPLSLTISASFPALPTSLQIWYGPASYHPELSRELFHETVHFWQYIASGYLTRLVEENWMRLVTFEQTGRLIKKAPCRDHYVTRDAKQGFSPRDLVEALARYWDVHVIGPPLLIDLEVRAGRYNFSAEFMQRLETLKQEKRLCHPETGGYSSESFDLAMEGAGGSWAKPYNLICKEMEQPVAGVFFPIAGHLALKTADPVSTFAFLISGGSSLKPVIPRGQNVSILWRWVFDLLSPLLQEMPEGRLLGTGIRVAGEGLLSKHPLWNWLVKYTLRAAAEIGCNRYGANDFETGVERGIDSLMFALACPGDPNNRGWLIPLLAPPIVTFIDGTDWNSARIAAKSLQASEAELRYTDDVALLAREINKRWNRFLVALRGY